MRDFRNEYFPNYNHLICSRGRLRDIYKEHGYRLVEGTGRSHPTVVNNNGVTFGFPNKHTNSISADLIMQAARNLGYRD